MAVRVLCQLPGRSEDSTLVYLPRGCNHGTYSQYCFTISPKVRSQATADSVAGNRDEMLRRPIVHRRCWQQFRLLLLPGFRKAITAARADHTAILGGGFVAVRSGPAKRGSFQQAAEMQQPPQGSQQPTSSAFTPVNAVSGVPEISLFSQLTPFLTSQQPQISQGGAWTPQQLALLQQLQFQQVSCLVEHVKTASETSTPADGTRLICLLHAAHRCRRR